MSKAENYCVDCGVEISQGATRCNSCANRVRWKRGDYDGQSEAMKARWAQGDFDSRNTEEYRRKRSEGMKAAWERGDYNGVFDEEYCRKQSEAAKAHWERGDFDGVFTSEEYRQGQSKMQKAAWARGDHDSEETKRKMSEALKTAWERGDFDGIHSEEHRHKQSEAVKEAWERGAYDGVFQSPTSIEIQTSAALDIMGIEHQSQYRPDGYSCIYDELIPPDTLIEIHGDYWHGDNFPEQQQRDAEKAQWADDNGYRLVVIWEHEIKRQGAWSLVIERVLPMMYNE